MERNNTRNDINQNLLSLINTSNSSNRIIEVSTTGREIDGRDSQLIAFDEAMGRAMELMAIRAIERETVRVSQNTSNSIEQNNSSNTNIQEGILVGNVIAYLDTIRNIYISINNPSQNLNNSNQNQNNQIPVIGTRIEEQYIYS